MPTIVLTNFSKAEDASDGSKMMRTYPIRVFIPGDALGDREAVRDALHEQPLSVTESDTLGVTQVHAIGEPVVTYGMNSDCTEPDECPAAERAVRESQRLISIGRLSAEIVHEINNPLESVGNLLYLALHEPGIPTRAVEFLRSAESELKRVVEISKQTLSFSRESTGPVELKAADLMDEVVHMYGRRIRQKRLVLVEDYAGDGSILAVPGEIRQVFSNLVTNAIEACAEGGKLSIRIRDVRMGEGSGVRITVFDNGIGIAHSVRTRIGEIFFTTKGASGTGLGLWVTKAIVSRHGGHMRLHSSTGKYHGTAFSVLLPAAEPKVATSSGTVAAPVTTAAERRPVATVTEISRHPRHANNALQSAITAAAAEDRQREG